PGGWLGALRPRGMGRLMATLACVGGTIGALDLAATAASEEWGQGWIAGALPSALSVGAIGGNALYGMRPWPWPVRTQLTVFAAALPLAWLPLAVAHTPAAAVGATLIAGLAFGPLLTVAFQAVDLLVARSAIREGYGWLISGMGLGIAAGSSLAGAIGAPLTLPLAAAALTALLAATVRRPLAAVAAPARLGMRFVVLPGGGER
ncbi:hypothetical protein AN218_15415, partial [Streptomyces nanshensis]